MNTKDYDCKLLADHDFKLSCYSDGGEIFVKLFREVWNAIPREDTDLMMGFWLEGEAHQRPRFEYSDMWHAENSSGQVRLNGREIRFKQSMFECFTNNYAKWVIAHELAHVFQKAIGRPPGGESEDENEWDADRIAKGWGFNEKVLSLVNAYQNNKGLSFEDAWKQVKADGYEDF